MQNTIVGYDTRNRIYSGCKAAASTHKSDKTKQTQTAIPLSMTDWNHLEKKFIEISWRDAETSKIKTGIWSSLTQPGVCMWDVLHNAITNGKSIQLTFYDIDGVTYITEINA